MARQNRYAFFERIKSAAQDTFLREWNVDKYLGSGSFGSVYSIVKHTSVGTSYSALKIVELDEESIKKYRNEISALSSVTNLSYTVKVEDYSEVIIDDVDYSRVFLIIRMELLEPLPADGLSEKETVKMGIQLCDTLARCHNMQPRILHCDIKPDNILIGRDGNYRLSDFGEARILNLSRASGSGNRGTPFFMSPEMHGYRGYDSRTDLYSLGISMYALLNGGNAPFYYGDMSGANEALRRRLNGERIPPIPGVSRELMKVIEKLCAYYPEDRYQTAAEAGGALKSLYRQMTTETATIAKPKKKTVSNEKSDFIGSGSISRSGGRKKSFAKLLLSRNNQRIAIITALIILVLVSITLLFIYPLSRNSTLPAKEQYSSQNEAANYDSIYVDITTTNERDAESPHEEMFITANRKGNEHLWHICISTNSMTEVSLLQGADYPKLNRVIVNNADSGELYAIDRRDGNISWSISDDLYSDYGFGGAMSIYEHEGTAYCISSVTRSNTLSAIDLSNGDRLWSMPLFTEYMDIVSAYDIECTDNMLRVYWEDVNTGDHYICEVDYSGKIIDTEIPDAGNRTRRFSQFHNDSSANQSTRLVFGQYTHSSAILNNSNEFHSEKAFDGSINTCWQEDTQGCGIGEWLMCKSETSQEIHSLCIFSGSYESESQYFDNGRALEIQVDAEGYSAKHKLIDEFSQPTLITFDSPIQSSYIKLTIVDATSGLKWDDTAISEIVVR